MSESNGTVKRSRLTIEDISKIGVLLKEQHAELNHCSRSELAEFLKQHGYETTSHNTLNQLAAGANIVLSSSRRSKSRAKKGSVTSKHIRRVSRIVKRVIIELGLDKNEDWQEDVELLTLIAGGKKKYEGEE